MREDERERGAKPTFTSGGHVYMSHGRVGKRRKKKEEEERKRCVKAGKDLLNSHSHGRAVMSAQEDDSKNRNMKLMASID